VLAAGLLQDAAPLGRLFCRHAFGPILDRSAYSTAAAAAPSGGRPVTTLSTTLGAAHPCLAMIRSLMPS
jgi:hypothetical protein